MLRGWRELGKLISMGKDFVRRLPPGERPQAFEGGATALGRSGRLTAVLGPTNTGKTHLAIERMLAHRSGMIGLPLRLLAREVYDKVVRQKGAADVALITGEERIVPKHPRFYVCTVEAMPVDLPVAFLAIDEIQLCADPERGHIFTDRLLHARGLEETMFLGAATMRGAIQRFAPQTQFITRPRFSDLAYTGAKKLTRLPRRSAVVAFSAEEVYGLADLVRSQRGGAAVVMGALSPRTRNAQVALYQSGDADFLIATDAIGMGINMDVDHVAFAALEKFDGVGVRPLRPEEVGQIAGRAGRYMNDGTFGVTGGAEPLDPELVAQVENHRYDPVRVLQWRSSDLNFSGLDHLLASLETPPPARGLVKARPASDHWTLRTLSGDEDIRDRTSAPAAVRLLWQACQLPDFRKLTPDEHARLVGQIYRHLIEDGVLPDAWLSHQITRLDITEGDVDTLSARLAQIRTWTYAAHRPGWTRDPAFWQELARGIEDRLSDALHEKLTQRFIDRRTSILMKHLRDEEILVLGVDDSGTVSLGSEQVGKLEGFRFAPDPRAEGIHGRTLRAAAMKGLEGELGGRARALAKASDAEIQLSEHGQLWWAGAAVARLEPGTHPLSPGVQLLADDVMKSEAREAIRARLERWTSEHVARVLEPLVALRRAAEARPAGAGMDLPAAARGLAFQLAENVGQLDRRAATLPDDMRTAANELRRFGVRIGKRSLYLPLLLKPAPSALAALLWAVHTRLERIPSVPTPGLTSIALDETPRPFLAAAYFRAIGPRAVRLDILERFEDILTEAARGKRKMEETMPTLASLLGCGVADVAAVAQALGWRQVRQGEGEASQTVWQSRAPERRHRGRGPDRRSEAKPLSDSPFADLAALVPGE
jgi:ATP-dependent RNA helicase SUPV3L1/SUV3